MAALTRPVAAAAAAVAIAATAVAAGVLALAGGPSPGLASPTAPLAVAASFRPGVVQFGDRLTATVTVLVDRGAVRPETLRVSDDLAPLTQLGPSRTSRTVAGALETVSVRVPVGCLTDPCVARAGVSPVALPRVRVSALSRSGTLDVAAVAWPRLPVRSRLSAADLAAARPPFAVETAPGSPAYRLSPTALALALDVVAAVCAAAVVALLALALHAALRRRRPAVGELERALRLARQAEDRTPPDRRRALGLLARLLDARDGALGRAADDLAWSERAPEADEVRRLLERIEGTGSS